MVEAKARTSVSQAAARTPQRQTAEKRRHIEATAAELFAARGFDGVSQRDIAAAAGIRLGTLTYLYADKQTLYDQTVAAAVTYFGAALVAAVAEPGPPLRRLQAFIACMVRLHADRTVPGEIIAREMMEGERSRMAVLGRGTFRLLRETIDPIIIAVVGRDLPRAEADRLAGQIINMTYAGVRSARFYGAAFGAAPASTEDQARQLSDLILYGIVPR